MASLWKHPQGQYWFACFTAKDGRQLKRSTKETNRSKAMKIAMEYETAARKTRTARQVRAVIQELQREITGEVLQSQSVRQFFANWVAEKRPSCSLSTITRYEDAGTKFLTFLGSKADGEIIQISRQDVRDFHNDALKRVSASTANGILKCLRMAFKTARRDSLIVEDPTEFVMRAKDETSDDDQERQPFTLEQIKLGVWAGDRRMEIDDYCGALHGTASFRRGYVALEQDRFGKQANQVSGPENREEVDHSDGRDSSRSSPGVDKAQTCGCSSASSSM